MLLEKLLPLPLESNSVSLIQLGSNGWSPTDNFSFSCLAFQISNADAFSFNDDFSPGPAFEGENPQDPFARLIEYRTVLSNDRSFISLS
jgi:hypothetical protein